MNSKYYSYRKTVTFNGQNTESEEENIFLNNEKGKIVRKKNGNIVENKKITKSEFKKYLRDRNLTISDTMMMNAVNLFNNVMLKNILIDENNSKKISKKLDTRKKLTAAQKKRVLKLKKKEIVNYLNKNFNLNLKENTRHTKKDLVQILENTLNKIDQTGGFFDNLTEPQPGFTGNRGEIQNKTLDFSFPEITKNNM